MNVENLILQKQHAQNRISITNLTLFKDTNPWTTVFRNGRFRRIALLAFMSPVSAFYGPGHYNIFNNMYVNV